MAPNIETSEKLVVWTWIIEYFASLPQLDFSILLDLMELAPELPCNLTENMKEMVALRILEELASVSCSDAGCSKVSCSKVSLDLSAKCGDVLSMMIGESLARDFSKMDMQELLKWDLCSYVEHKRALMPICGLEQLKSAIHDGTHPNAASLMVHSGWLCPKDNRSQISADHGRCLGTNCSGSVVLKNAQKQISMPNLFGKDNGVLDQRNLLPSKRCRSDGSNENVSVDVHQTQSYVHDGDQLDGSAKRKKKDFVCINQSSVTTPTSLGIRRLIEGCSGKLVGVPEGEDCHLGKDVQLKDFNKTDSLEGVQGKCSDNERLPLGTSNAVIDQHQNNNDEIAQTTYKRPQDAYIDGIPQHIPSNESSGPSSTELFNNTHHEESAGEGKNDSTAGHLESQQVNEFNREALSNEVDDSKDHFHEDCSSSDSDEFHHERVDVAWEKSQFLSSQCGLTSDSLASSGWTEHNLCIKCNKDGQLLVCSTLSCPLAVHETCLGSAASFDELGHFYCPFCAYSRAVADYRDAKKNASLARRVLTEVIQLGLKDQAKEQNDRLHDGNSRKSIGEDLPKTPANVDLENTERNQVSNGKVCNHHRLRIKGDKQVVEPAAMYNGADNQGRLEEPDVIVRKGEETVPNYSAGGGFVAVNRENQNFSDSLLNNCEVMSPANNGKTDEGIQKESAKQFAKSLEEPICAVSNDENESSSDDEDDRSTSSNYFISVRKKTNCSYPTIPALPQYQLRRNKVPWTTEEEEKLKEGMLKFSSTNSKKTPWKLILEYGGRVFFGRTTVDLKDKWRNMCKQGFRLE